MKPNEFNGLELPNDNDDEAVREFGRQIAMDGILREFLSGASTEEPSTSQSQIKVGIKPTEPSTTQSSKNWTRTLAIAVAVLAASVLVLLGLRGVWTPEINNSSQLASRGIGIREDLTVVGWVIKAHPEADPRRTDARRQGRRCTSTQSHHTQLWKSCFATNRNWIKKIWIMKLWAIQITDA